MDLINLYSNSFKRNISLGWRDFTEEEEENEQPTEGPSVEDVEEKCKPIHFLVSNSELERS